MNNSIEKDKIVKVPVSAVVQPCTPLSSGTLTPLVGAPTVPSVPSSVVRVKDVRPVKTLGAILPGVLLHHLVLVVTVGYQLRRALIIKA